MFHYHHHCKFSSRRCQRLFDCASCLQKLALKYGRFIHHCILEAANYSLLLRNRPTRSTGFLLSHFDSMQEISQFSHFPRVSALLRCTPDNQAGESDLSFILAYFSVPTISHSRAKANETLPVPSSNIVYALPCTHVCVSQSSHHSPIATPSLNHPDAPPSHPIAYEQTTSVSFIQNLYNTCSSR
jgi:hypothetical protein